MATSPNITVSESVDTFLRSADQAEMRQNLDIGVRAYPAGGGNVTKNRFVIIITSTGAVRALQMNSAMTVPPAGVALNGGAIGEHINVALYGCAVRPLMVEASMNISAGQDLYLEPNGGRVRSLPAAPGDYWFVGTSLNAGNTGEIIEVNPIGIRLVTVS